MEGIREFLEIVRKNQLVRGYFRALTHIVIGRRITTASGVTISSGVSWRQLSELLRLIRWDRELVREIGLDPDDLPPRDRQRFWYSAIIAAGVDTPQASREADEYLRLLEPLGYIVGPAPGGK